VIPVKWALIVVAELAGCVGLGFLLAMQLDQRRRENCARIQSPLVYDDVLELGRRVEPVKNCNGVRDCGVRVGASVKPPHPIVPRLLNELLEDVGQESPEEWFRRYEEVHPFRDGNGRTGQILYNWLRGTLDAPVWAPDYWGDPRRGPGFGAPA
jgi:hypothetical protein